MSNRSNPPDAPRVVLLPSDRFFIRTVPLVNEGEESAQITLALESVTPFPPGQLYYGFLRRSSEELALVFAAYRKRFTGEETVEWEQADVVLPQFIALLGSLPRIPAIRLLVEDQAIVVAAWDGTGKLPVAVLARATTHPADAAGRAALVEEIRLRTGLESAVVQEFSGAPRVVQSEGDGTISLELTGAPIRITTEFDRQELENLDMRDREFLARRRTILRRDRLLWRGFAIGLGGLVAMLLLETGLFAGGLRLRQEQEIVREQTPAVEKIMTAQSLSTRIGEMTGRRLMPFEMLARINRSRPASIQFMRVTTTGIHSLEIEAQTSNPPDVSQYEGQLRAVPELELIEARDMRSRNGLTSFTLAVTFKAKSLQAEVGL